MHVLDSLFCFSSPSNFIGALSFLENIPLGFCFIKALTFSSFWQKLLKNTKTHFVSTIWIKGGTLDHFLSKFNVEIKENGVKQRGRISSK